MGEQYRWENRKLRHMGRGESLIKEVAEDACARPHSCFGCIIINANDIIYDSNEEACIEGIGFYVRQPDNKYKVVL